MKLELDCASALFVLGREEQRKYQIQYAIRLDEPVDGAVLQDALASAVRQYPTMFLRFVRGISRLYGETAGYAPKVVRLDPGAWRQSRIGNCMYEAQVGYFGNTIVLTYSHFITDGRGGLEFLKYLTAEYLARTHPGEDAGSELPVPSLQEQTQNGYRACGKGLCGAGKWGTAYQIKGSPLGSAAAPKVSTYRLSALQVRRLARECQASVTEWMSALLCTAIWGVQKESGSKAWPGRIRLTVPVDLRPRFSCRTMRNFSLNVYPSVNPAGEDMSLSALCGRFHRYMEGATQTERLAGRCAVSERIGNGALIRMLPFAWKQKLVQAALRFSGSTMTFSNLGVVRMPAAMRDHVDSLDVTFTPKPDSPYTCSMLTLKDNMRLTLLRSIREPRLETELERVFRERNIAFAAERS